jgi:hypothetical protein
LSGSGREARRVLPALVQWKVKGRPFADLIKPALDVGKFAEVDILRFSGSRPRIANHVGDRVLACGQVSRHAASLRRQVVTAAVL